MFTLLRIFLVHVWTESVRETGPMQGNKHSILTLNFKHDVSSKKGESGEGAQFKVGSVT